MEDNIMKNRQTKFKKNISNNFTIRGETFKLNLRKHSVDKYIENKRMKLIELYNSPDSLDFKELNINKELNFQEIMDKLNILIMEREKWYEETTVLKECVINIRKITCRYLVRDIDLLLKNKIEILLFNILEYYQCKTNVKEEENAVIKEALWAITNMVCVSSPIFNEIKKRNFLSVLKNFIFSSNDTIVDQCILCIGNIVVEGNEFRDNAIKLGILDRVVKLSKDTSKSLDLIKNCMFLISNLLMNKPQPHLEKIGPSLLILSACLWHKDLEIVKICLWSFAYISDGYETLQEKVVSLGCIPKIMEFANIKIKELQLPSLRIIGNLAAGSNKLAEVLMENDVIKLLIDMLNNSHQDKIFNEIIWSLNNFSQSSIRVINYMNSSDKLNSCLIKLLLNDSCQATVRYQVISIYYNFVKHGNNITVESIIERGVFETICHLLLSMDSLDQHTLLMSLGFVNKIIMSKISYCENHKVWNIIQKSKLVNKVENFIKNGVVSDSITQLIEKFLQNVNSLSLNLSQMNIY